MAVTGRLRNLIVAIVAALFFCMVYSGVPFQSGIETASADAGESRLLIAWDRGRVGLESLLSLDAMNMGVGKALEQIPGLVQELQEGSWPAPSIQTITLPDGNVAEAARQVISKLPGVLYVENDAVVSAGRISGDPYVSRQWYLSHIGAERAWDAGTGDAAVIVAVVDTGVDGTHPDLAGRVLSGYDFVADNENTPDLSGHGTHVAGIAAASGDNGQGVAGLAWSTSVLPVRVLDENGQGYYSDVIAGIRYAADRGADVINLSLGGGACSHALQEAVDYARSKGSVIVAAAGNDALDSLSYPAACQGVIAVGACDENDNPTTFSNRGEGLDLVAPGTSIYSDYPGGGYARMSGTSMAAPQVSGALALIFALNPGIGVDEAESRITGTATDLGAAGYDESSGWGLLRVDKALGLEDLGGDIKPGDGALYFAEGYTGPGFDTYLLLENPDTQMSEALLELFGPGGRLSATEVRVAPRSRLTMRINDMAPVGEVAIRISLPEGSQLQAQRSMYFDYNGLHDGHTSRASGASNEWYFAEGYTGSGFDTYILVFNPQESTARVDLRLMTPDGEHRFDMEVAPLSRRTLKLNDILPGAEIAAALVSDVPVVAERAMYFDLPGRQGGSVVMGAEATSEGWYFAEGYTGGDFDEWLLLANPSEQTVTAIASFERSDGLTVERDVTLKPRSRTTLHVDEIAGLENAEVSTSIKAACPGVVAERAMYFAYTGSMGTVGGGHAAMGATSPSSRWLIPEGYTGAGFESWILVSNLEEETVVVNVEILGESGRVVSREFAIAPHSRLSIKENDLLSGEGVSAEVSAPDGTLLVVEGAFYYRYRDGIEGGSA